MGSRTRLPARTLGLTSRASACGTTTGSGAKGGCFPATTWPRSSLTRRSAPRPTESRLAVASALLVASSSPLAHCRVARASHTAWRELCDLVVVVVVVFMFFLQAEEEEEEE